MLKALTHGMLLIESNIDNLNLDECKPIKEVKSSKLWTKLNLNNYDTGLVKTKFNKVNENNKYFFYKNIREFYLTFSNFETRKLSLSNEE